MNRQNSKQAKKQVIIDAMRYGVIELRTCISIVVLTCCRASVLTYRNADLLSYISIEVWKCRRNVVYQY
jgi:hypothetical protein